MSTSTSSYNPKSAVFRVPVFGQLFRDAVFGHEDAKYYFAANMVFVLFWSFITFGYPAVIIYALTGTFCALTFLVVLTSQDIIENWGKKKPEAPAKKKAGAV
jgi:hypothetical protein